MPTHRHKPRLGQHFLSDQRILSKILDYVPTQTTLLEIGCGKGVLTQKLAERAKNLLVIEIDSALLDITQKKLANQHNVTFLEADVLKADFTTLLTEPCYEVVANIPYYITAPIIEKMIANKSKISRCLLMVQKEVAQRITAAPGKKIYGSFSVFCQYHATCKMLFDVPRTAFQPPPEVDSAVIQLDMRQYPLNAELDEVFFFQLIRAAFWGKRKTLVNSASKSPYLALKKETIENILTNDLNLSPLIRAEQISIEQFIKLAILLKNELKK